MGWRAATGVEEMIADKSPETLAAEQRARAAAEAYVNAWAHNDRAALLNAFAENATWVDPAGTTPWQGRAKIGEFWDMAHSGGVTLSPVVHRIVVCGNEAILLFRMEVRMPGGGGMGVETCDQMLIDDHGKILSGKAYWDQDCVVPIDT
jgi:steroid delta-isomerase